MSAMRVLAGVSRYLMGLPLFIFGSNAFIRFLPMPMPNEVLPEEGGFSPDAFELLNQLWDSGYIMHMVCALHAVTGATLLINRYVPLGLAIHLPVSIQMTLFHIVHDPATGFMAYLILGLNLFLMFAYREAYNPLLRAKHTLSASELSDEEASAESE